MVGRLVLLYAVGLFILLVGTRHPYWVWTGQTAELTTVIEGPLAEEPRSRRLMWMVGGPILVVGRLALMGVVIWLLVRT